MVRRKAQPSQLALGRHCAQPTSRPGEGRESRGPEAGSDRQKGVSHGPGVGAAVTVSLGRHCGRPAPGDR